MAPRIQSPYTDGFNPVDIETEHLSKENIESKENSELQSQSESDENFPFIPGSQHRNKIKLHSIVNRLQALDPRAWIFAAVLLLVTLVGMNIAILTIVRDKGIKPRYATHKPLFNSDGLRIAPNGLIAECGKTHVEAIKNGCIFDVMAFEFVPPACYDEELLKDAIDPLSFLAPNVAGIFPFFRWHNHTGPVPQDGKELQKYNYIWTNQDWHKGHCLYMWRTLSKAVTRVLKGDEGVYVLSGATEPGHVNHCNLLISDKIDAGDTPLRAFRSIGTCVRLDGPDGEVEKLLDF